MKKVMIVGAGAGQCPLILRCKEYGFYTIVVSPNGPYPGIKIADKHINEDIFNKESLVEWGKMEAIDYVISDQSDYAVPIVAYVAEKLGLNGNLVEVAETYTYKSKFRDFCHKYGIPAPKSIVVEPSNIDSALLNQLSFPVVVKPADSQGSRGVSKLSEKVYLQNAIKEAGKYSKENKVVVEEFFDGHEIVCEGFVMNGEYFNVGFGDRHYFSLEDRFIPSKTVFPANLSSSIKDLLIDNERKIAKILKPKFGIVHSEYIINKNGAFVIIESALRGGGVYIASHLIPLSTGIDLTEVLILAMIGEIRKCRGLLQPSTSAAAEYLCFYLREGIVSMIEGQNRILDLPNVLISEIDNINVGDSVQKFEHKGMRKGPFIIKGKDKEDLVRTENFIKNTLEINIDGFPGIIWK